MILTTYCTNWDDPPSRDDEISSTTKTHVSFIFSGLFHPYFEGIKPQTIFLGFTLPETNSSPLKIGLPNRKVVSQPSIFRCELLVSGRVGAPAGSLFAAAFRDSEPPPGIRFAAVNFYHRKPQIDDAEWLGDFRFSCNPQQKHHSFSLCNPQRTWLFFVQPHKNQRFFFKRFWSFFFQDLQCFFLRWCQDLCCYQGAPRKIGIRRT